MQAVTQSSAFANLEPRRQLLLTEISRRLSALGYKQIDRKRTVSPEAFSDAEMWAPVQDWEKYESTWFTKQPSPDCVGGEPIRILHSSPVSISIIKANGPQAQAVEAIQSVLMENGHPGLKPVEDRPTTMWCEI